MRFSTFFIDLDDTVYPSDAGIWALIRARIDTYMHERLGFSPAEIPELRASLFHTYGTTLRGLQMCYQVDMLDFLSFVHDVPIDQILKPNPQLRALLLSYPQRKIIFTNSDLPHSRRVLNALQISDCFERIIDIHDIAPNCKPQIEAYQRALALSGDPNPEECVMLDDSPRNLHTASQLGMFTVCIGSHLDGECSVKISNLLELPTVIPPSNEVTLG